MAVKLKLRGEIVLRHAMHSSFNGCSASCFRLEPPSTFSSQTSDRTSITKEFAKHFTKNVINKRLRIIFGDGSVAVTKLKLPDYRQFRLRRSAKTIAAIGVAGSIPITKDTCPTFLLDPQRTASMIPLIQTGLMNPTNKDGKECRPLPYDKLGPTIPLPKVNAVALPQIRFMETCSSRYTIETPRKDYWSDENSGIIHLGTLRWWDREWLLGRKVSPIESLIKSTVEAASQYLYNRDTGKSMRDYVFVAGSCVFKSDSDSCRIIMGFIDKSPESLDPMAVTFLEDSKGRKVYYKVLPFYYHSPQHSDHKVMAMFLSTQPLRLKEL